MYYWVSKANQKFWNCEIFVVVMNSINLFNNIKRSFLILIILSLKPFKVNLKIIYDLLIEHQVYIKESNGLLFL